MAETGSQVAELHSDLARNHRDLGAVLSQSNRSEEAEAERRTALAFRRELADRNPGMALYRDDLAGGYTDLADTIRALGRAAEARDAYDRALALLDALPSRGVYDWYETACCHAALAGAGVSSGPGPAEADRATDLLRRAVAMGFRDVHDRRTEAALDPLRDRDDFRLMNDGPGLRGRPVRPLRWPRGGRGPTPDPAPTGRPSGFRPSSPTGGSCHRRPVNGYASSTLMDDPIPRPWAPGGATCMQSRTRA